MTTAERVTKTGSAGKVAACTLRGARATRAKLRSERAVFIFACHRNCSRRYAGTQFLREPVCALSEL